jgi:uncharacterized membrane protein YvbJ
MLLPCKECGKEISSTARSCPHCGTSRPVNVNKLPVSDQIKYFFSLPIHEQIKHIIGFNLAILFIILLIVLVAS